MAEVVAMIDGTKDELSEVRQWAEQRIKSGQYVETTGRFKVSAMMALAEVLMDTEPRAAQYMHDNVEDITDRWATKYKASGDTPRTYRSRAKGLLTDYLGWKADPSGFRLERSVPTRKPREKVYEKKENIEAAPAAKPMPSEFIETIRLDGGRIFKFIVGDITQKDAGRIAYALLARATDFDPSVGFNFGRSPPSEPSPNGVGGTEQLPG